MSKRTFYPVIFNPNSDGGFDVTFPDFPGCVTFGRNFEEAQAKAQEVLELWIEELSASHTLLPPRRANLPILTEVQVAA